MCGCGRQLPPANEWIASPACSYPRTPTRTIGMYHTYMQHPPCHNITARSKPNQAKLKMKQKQTANKTYKHKRVQPGLRTSTCGCHTTPGTYSHIRTCSDPHWTTTRKSKKDDRKTFPIKNTNATVTSTPPPVRRHRVLARRVRSPHPALRRRCIGRHRSARSPVRFRVNLVHRRCET